MTAEEREKILRNLPVGAEVYPVYYPVTGVFGKLSKKADHPDRMSVYSFTMRSLTVSYQDLTCDAIVIADKLAPRNEFQEFFDETFDEVVQEASKKFGVPIEHLFKKT